MMYGTVARLSIKPGFTQAALTTLAETESEYVPGVIAVHIYQMDQNPDDLYMVVLFETREAYQANAASPEQHARYLRIRQYLTADPDWHDGRVVFSYRP